MTGPRANRNCVLFAWFGRGGSGERPERSSPRRFFQIAFATTVLLAVALTARAADWQAGFARQVITPEKPLWLSGYGGRDKPATGKTSDLYARAAAIADPSGTTVVVLAVDLIGVHDGMVREIAAAVEKRHGVPRERLMVASSHTHSGPALDHKLSGMLDMKDEDWEAVHAYQKVLNAALIDVIGRAMDDRQPAALAFGHTRAGFAANRRAPINTGPYDHDVPVLRFLSSDGLRVRGVIYGYACHATVLPFYEWCGDYPGFASQYLEDRNPGAVALFAAGCGADQNPLPRRKVELAEKYGRLLGVAVDEALKASLAPVKGSLAAAYRTTDLAFESVPTRADLETALKHTSRYERVRARTLLKELDANGSIAGAYPYPVQVWRFGESFTWVSLGGEVVVDYALRLKRELGEGSTWVTGYANDVMAYIPSERVLREGGYEGASSMIVYLQPSPWKAGLEDQIVSTVKSLADGLRAK